MKRSFLFSSFYSFCLGIFVGFFICLCSLFFHSKPFPIRILHIQICEFSFWMWHCIAFISVMWNKLYKDERVCLCVCVCISSYIQNINSLVYPPHIYFASYVHVHFSATETLPKHLNIDFNVHTNISAHWISYLIYSG